jgi:hypothetical protein
MKNALGLNLPGFLKRIFSIRKKGTNAISRIRPEHQLVHANPERIPPITDNATRVYLFIYSFGFLILTESGLLIIYNPAKITRTEINIDIVKCSLSEIPHKVATIGIK